MSEKLNLLQTITVLKSFIMVRISKMILSCQSVPNCPTRRFIVRFKKTLYVQVIKRSEKIGTITLISIVGGVLFRSMLRI